MTAWWWSAAGPARSGGREHARRTHDAYLLDGEPLWGISVFCALDDIGTASLDALLRRFASYRVVHLPTMGRLVVAGFELLPSFRRPHFTVRMDGEDDENLTRSSTHSGRRTPTRTMVGSGREGH